MECAIAHITTAHRALEAAARAASAPPFSPRADPPGPGTLPSRDACGFLLEPLLPHLATFARALARAAREAFLQAAAAGLAQAPPPSSPARALSGRQGTAARLTAET